MGKKRFRSDFFEQGPPTYSCSSCNVIVYSEELYDMTPFERFFWGVYGWCVTCQENNEE